MHGIGLLGCGVVGSAVARRLLATERERLIAIAVRDPHKSRDVDWSTWSDDPFGVVDDPRVRIVVECIGGTNLARELVLRAISHGKDVITANKDLIAHDGPWLAAFAARTGASLHFEAAVGGAIPIVRALHGALAAEDVREIGGVVNGTTNFILSALERGDDYDAALARAQALGFAEADPSSDVEGFDPAFKLAILATNAFGRPVAPSAITRRGIVGLSPDDVRAGEERNWRLKLVALARRREDGDVDAIVSPMYVPRTHPFARPNDAENVIRAIGAASGPLEFFGHGAGGDASGSAVIADVFHVVRRRAAGLEPSRRDYAEPLAVHPLTLGEGTRGIPVLCDA